MDAISPDGFDFFTPHGYNKNDREGKKVLNEHPRHRGANDHRSQWPILLHSEYALLTDINLATPETVFQDKPHFDFGIVPGDGVNCSGLKFSAAFADATSF